MGRFIQSTDCLVEVIVSIFGMLLGHFKTSDKCENGISGTPLRALKTLTS